MRRPLTPLILLYQLPLLRQSAFSGFPPLKCRTPGLRQDRRASQSNGMSRLLLRITAFGTRELGHRIALATAASTCSESEGIESFGERSSVWVRGALGAPVKASALHGAPQ